MAAGRAYLEESVRLAREQGNPWIAAVMLFSLGSMLSQWGDPGEARARLEESAALFRDLRDRRFVNAAGSELAHLLRRQGNYAEAVALYRETIARWVELGYRAAIAHQLESLAFIAAAQGHSLRAARLLGAAEVVREAAKAAMARREREEYERVVAEVRARLDQATFAAAWAEGRAMPLEQAIEYALDEAS